MRSILSLILAVTLTFVIAYAQTPPQRVNVPFDFAAGNKALPAGQYEVMSANRGTPTVTLRNGKLVANVGVITALARPQSDLNFIRLVFDKVEGKQILSEVWLPGQDGLLVHAQKGNHAHETLPRR